MTFHCPNCNVELAVMRASGTTLNAVPAAFPAQPAPVIAGLYCPVHGVPAVVKPAGFRKDGTSYPSFPVCPDPSCRARPVRQNGAQPVQNAPGAAQGYGVASVPTGELP